MPPPSAKLSPSSGPPPDPARFTRAYEEHHDALYRYCRSILRDEHDAHDALSSAITKAFAAWQRQPQIDDLRPWLFRIAHNEAISLLRGRRSVPVADVPDAATDGLELTVERRARLEHLDRDLSALPETQRAAIVLRELNGLGHDEIAAILGSTPRAVKQLIYEARVGLMDAEAGREMSCAGIQRSISDGDARVLRGRRVRAHLRSCQGCRRFRTAMRERPADLALLVPPLAPVSAGVMLAHALQAGGGVAGSAAALGHGVGGGAAATGSAAGMASAGAGASSTGAVIATGTAAAVGGAVRTKAVVAAAALLGLGGGAAVEQHARHANRPAAHAPAPSVSAPTRGRTIGAHTHAPAPVVTVPAAPTAQPAARRKPAHAEQSRKTAPARAHGTPAAPALAHAHAHGGAGAAHGAQAAHKSPQAAGAANQHGKAQPHAVAKPQKADHPARAAGTVRRPVAPPQLPAAAGTRKPAAAQGKPQGSAAGPSTLPAVPVVPEHHATKKPAAG